MDNQRWGIWFFALCGFWVALLPIVLSPGCQMSPAAKDGYSLFVVGFPFAVVGGMKLLARILQHFGH